MAKLERRISNLGQYAKIGFGTLCVLAGAKEYIGGVLSKANVEQALYRGLEAVNVDKIIEAKKSLDVAFGKMHGNYITPIAIAVGAGLLASGIYNLAKKYHSERIE